MSYTLSTALFLVGLLEFESRTRCHYLLDNEHFTQTAKTLVTDLQ